MLLVILASIILGTLVILATPRRYFWYGIRWLSFPIIFILFLLSQLTGDGGLSEILGIMIILALFALVGLLLGLKWLFLWYTGRNKNNIKPGIPISKLQLCCYGIMTSLFYFYGMLAVPAKHAPVWKAYLLILCTGIILYAIGLLLAYLYKSPRLSQWNYFLSSFLLATTLLMTANAISPLYVSYKAEEKASGRPYCIEITNGPAQALIDLSIPKMLSPKGPNGYYTTHAIMIAYENHKPQIFHWSYRHGDFMGSFSSHPSPWLEHYPATCVPEVNFTKKLPLISPVKTKNSSIVIAGQRLDIPLSYHSRVDHSERSLSIITQGISLLPFDKPLNTLSWNERLNGVITISLDPGKNKQTINSIIPDFNHQFKNQEKLYDLYRYTSNNGDEFLYELDKDGALTTIIQKKSSPWADYFEYHQYFLQDGWMYQLNYDKDELKNWKTHQKRILKLVNSFKNKEHHPY